MDTSILEKYKENFDVSKLVGKIFTSIKAYVIFPWPIRLKVSFACIFDFFR
jgi:hypothetical protein